MDLRAEDDRALVDRLRRRERGAFDELYRLHPLFALALVVCTVGVARAGQRELRARAATPAGA